MVHGASAAGEAASGQVLQGAADPADVIVAIERLEYKGQLRGRDAHTLIVHHQDHAAPRHRVFLPNGDADVAAGPPTCRTCSSGFAAAATSQARSRAAAWGWQRRAG